MATHIWMPTLGGNEECVSCHATVGGMRGRGTVCEHFWAFDNTTRAHDCNLCGGQVSAKDMIAGNFPWKCPGNPGASYVPPAVIPMPANPAPFPAMPVTAGMFTPWPAPVYSDFDLGRPVRETKSPGKYPRCRACDRELCADLDAYYGVDPELVGKCDPCRRGRRP